MQIYELGYLILPSIGDDKVDGVSGAIKATIAKHEGKEIDGEAPFLHDLTYTMNKTVGASRYVVNEAYLGWIKFETEPENVLKIKADVENMDEVLRSLLIKAPRETGFTFAQARKKLEIESEIEPVEAGAPAEITVE